MPIRTLVCVWAFLGAMPMEDCLGEIPDLFKSPGVIVPDGGFNKPRVTFIQQGTGALLEGAMVDSPFPQFVKTNLPADDRGKFHILVFLGKDLQSQMLKRDFRQDADLLALKDWCKY